MRLLHRLEIDIRLRHVEKLPVKFHRIGGPDGLEQWQIFIRQRASFRHISAGRIHFIFLPAKTQTTLSRPLERTSSVVNRRASTTGLW